MVIANKIYSTIVTYLSKELTHIDLALRHLAPVEGITSIYICTSLLRTSVVFHSLFIHSLFLDSLLPVDLAYDRINADGLFGGDGCILPDEGVG
jgi:hypothetical protein